MAYLTEKELKLLESHLSEHTYRKVSDIIHYLIEEFDVEYTKGGMRGILSALNFVYKKPEKIPFGVDEKAQKKFVSEYRKLSKKLTAEDGLHFMDATEINSLNTI